MIAFVRFLSLCCLIGLASGLLVNQPELAAAEGDVIKVGIIGLDTSHVPSFTKTFNVENSEPDVAGFQVVAAYPQGSTVIESSYSRIPKYTEEVKAMGVEIVGSIDELIEKVDVVMLETNDGNPHLEQVLPCLKAGKLTFIDKPIAGSLADTLAIFKASEIYKTPVFSSSSLRYSPGAQEIRGGAIGDVLGCDAYSPASLDSTHPDLYWYGIHGVETLFTCMGAGCESVVRTQTENFEQVTGVWSGGRIGTFRGIRDGASGYGGTAFGSKQIREIGKYAGYRPLVVEIAKFYKTGESPVPNEETIQIYAFMAAADESKAQGGKPVMIKDVMDKAAADADARLKELGVIK
ncbi:MAG: dehydrogenase [Planctomyces sp.]|nr:dehydrogenase [Planctomyces sp.]